MTQQCWGICVVLALAMSACTLQQKESAPTMNEIAMPEPESTVVVPAPPPPQGFAASGSPDGAREFARRRVSVESSVQDALRLQDERKLIRKGELTVEVQEMVAALAKLREIVSSLGGYTADLSERQNQYGLRTASVNWKVPVDRLEKAIEAVKQLGTPRTVALSADDVTIEYFDTTVRLETQKQLERQLLALLQRPTNKLSELLEVERELARVREEIDRMEGRKRLWDHQIALSSLVITLEEPHAAVAGTGGGPLRTLGEAIVEAGENFGAGRRWDHCLLGLAPSNRFPHHVHGLDDGPTPAPTTRAPGNNLT